MRWGRPSRRLLCGPIQSSHNAQVCKPIWWDRHDADANTEAGTDRETDADTGGGAKAYPKPDQKAGEEQKKEDKEKIPYALPKIY